MMKSASVWWLTQREHGVILPMHVALTWTILHRQSRVLLRWAHSLYYGGHVVFWSEIVGVFIVRGAERRHMKLKSSSFQLSDNYDGLIFSISQSKLSRRFCEFLLQKILTKLTELESVLCGYSSQSSAFWHMARNMFELDFQASII